MRKRNGFSCCRSRLLGMLLFVFIGGGSRDAPVELAAAAALRLAPDHLLASARAAGAVPDPLRRILAHGSGRSNSSTPEERERFRKAMRERWGFGLPSFCGTKGNETASTPPKGSGEE